MKEVFDEPLRQRFIDRSGFGDYFSFPVAEVVRLYRAARGAHILREGDPVDRLIYLVSGRARLSESLPNGKSVLLDFPQATCFFGELELLGVPGETLGIRALTNCWLLVLPFDTCRHALLNDVKFLRFLGTYLGEKSRRMERTIVRTHGYPLANRLAEFLLTAACGDQYRERNVDAAEYLGVSYRHLQQTLSDFVCRGYLEKQGRSYTLRDVAALRQLADAMQQGQP